MIADNVDAAFRIEDQDAPPLVFSEKNRRDLNAQPDPADEVAQTLAERYPNMKRWRFVSDDLVPCRQQARKSLQLYQGDHRVVASLPNPAPGKYATITVISNGASQ